VFLEKSLKSLLCLAVFASLSGCIGTGDEATISLPQPESIRQVAAINASDVFVLINVNNDPVQRFDANPNDNSIVSVTGIVRNEENTITVGWYETVDGRRIQLSEQSQTFLADGNSTEINTPHSYAFDFDRDGINNWDERIGESCVWFDTQQCPSDDGNLLLNGDFTNLREHWFHAYTHTPDFYNGEYCVSSYATDSENPLGGFGYSEALDLMEGQYTLTFDIRAENNSEATAQISISRNEGGNRTSVNRAFVPVSTDYVTNSVDFVFQRDWDLISLGIGVGRDGLANRYCIDNLIFVRTG